MKQKPSQTTVPWKAKHVRVAVVGDVMLDEYLWGDVKRISPEAPVPIHHVKETTYSPGGAANVALNIKCCEGEVELWGRIGPDESGQKLMSCLQQQKVDTQHLHKQAIPTIKKTRIVTSSQQIARIDFEDTHVISDSDADKILKGFQPQSYAAVILSDYNKGFLSTYLCQQVIAQCSKKNIPTIVDPKSNDFSKYSGAFLITPNFSEACVALGLSAVEKHDPAKMAKELVKKFDVKNALITLGAGGMVWADYEGKTFFLPALAKEVFDVSGAGDTVLAVMALAIAVKDEFPNAMHWANYAAHIVVQKKGTQPVYLAELEAGGRIQSGYQTTTSYKIVSKEQIRENGRLPDQKVVFTNGCFDILHVGHIDYLEAARKRGDLLIVGLNSDASVKRLKGESRPIIPCEQRARVLAALACVDYVVIYDEDTPHDLIKYLMPDILVKGADWEKAKIVGKDIVEQAGGEVDNIEFTPGVSTTSIIKRIHSLTKSMQ